MSTTEAAPRVEHDHEDRETDRYVSESVKSAGEAMVEAAGEQEELAAPAPGEMPQTSPLNRKEFGDKVLTDHLQDRGDLRTVQVSRKPRIVNKIKGSLHRIAKRHKDGSVTYVTSRPSVLGGRVDKTTSVIPRLDGRSIVANTVERFGEDNNLIRSTETSNVLTADMTVKQKQAARRTSQAIRDRATAAVVGDGSNIEQVKEDARGNLVEKPRVPAEAANYPEAKTYQARKRGESAASPDKGGSLPF